MLKVGVIEACTPEEVKCISATTLAQKAHEGKGLSLEELQHRVNNECMTHGMETKFDLPPRTDPTSDDSTPSDQKWRICQNFSQINKLTKVAPMPQGDIRAKQQCLSGHRWVSRFDFAAGFYVVLLGPESRPYTAFYVEGRGYYQYKRMPFGLTGGPSTFANVTAKHMYDLLVEEILELFVDDGGAAADTFDEMMDKLTRIFTQIREAKLSLSEGGECGRSSVHSVRYHYRKGISAYKAGKVCPTVFQSFLPENFPSIFHFFFINVRYVGDKI